MKHLRNALAYMRAHRAQTTAAALILVGLVANLIPGFPSDQVMGALSLLLGA